MNLEEPKRIQIILQALTGVKYYNSDIGRHELGIFLQMLIVKLHPTANAGKDVNLHLFMARLCVYLESVLHVTTVRATDNSTT